MLIDGMIIRVDNIAEQEKLGWTSKFPRWMSAYKFPAIEKTTKIKSVSFQVGRTGIITPVANLDPINIDGVNVSRVSLYNFHKISEMDLKINDIVSLIRSGDVIPKISKIFKDRRDGKEKNIEKPILCPSCLEKVEYCEKQAICKNLNCIEKKIYSILYWAENMNINGLGYQTVKILITEKKIENIIDLYNLEIVNLLNLKGFQKRKSENIINSIQSSINSRSLENIISSLGIQHIGTVSTQLIFKKFGLNFIDLKEKDLNLIDGFGEEMSKSFYKFIIENRDFILKLLKILKPILKEKQNVKNNKFKNKIIVLTGTMSKNREKIKKYLENLGAIISNSITKKTDLLIYGEQAGSKLNKAKKLNIKILSENEI